MRGLCPLQQGHQDNARTRAAETTFPSSCPLQHSCPAAGPLPEQGAEQNSPGCSTTASPPGERVGPPRRGLGPSRALSSRCTRQRPECTLLNPQASPDPPTHTAHKLHREQGHPQPEHVAPPPPASPHDCQPGTFPAKVPTAARGGTGLPGTAAGPRAGGAVRHFQTDVGHHLSPPCQHPQSLKPRRLAPSPAPLRE